ncbi:MAG: SRPBCC domain-containing protein [Mucilaginibacter sp.]
MQNNNLTLTFLVDQSPREVFNAVNNVRGWWSEKLEGSSEKLDDEFSYRHGDLHYSKHKLIDVVPNSKVVWLTTASDLTFVDKTDEWTGTKVIFDISEQDGKTRLQFTHDGLVSQFQCFEACSGGWNHYLTKSLLPLIQTGIGQPDKK